MDADRSILAVTDFSSASVHAARRAARLAAERGSRMILLHVVEPDGLVALREWFDKGRDLRAAIAEQARMQLDAQADPIEQELGVRIERLVRQGRALDEVHQAGAASDLVVLAGRCDEAGREAALATLADRLVRSADRPVLVVRRAPDQAYARTLVLTDFSPAAQAALRAALAVAPGAEVHLLHAFDIPFEGKLRLAGVSDDDIAAYRREIRTRALAQMQQALDAVGAPEGARTSLVPGDVRVEAVRAIEHLQPDLVAVGKQGDSLLEDMLLGSTTSAMLERAGCDMLIVPRRAAGVQESAPSS
ncbi:universal stress protein [Ramlibacter alkalitolerans]|uniref:Universal stress protein n=1 Tax=Ramlibacter alkalitolerans TaxID=2039631 RepID=A0ABS1JTM8_9BURK|nr:universal stress protein [Ramlibacter alkalitolerans]MBL0427521.1 universal stress protein [Ramlibacter alkalitolerans]